MWIATYRSLSNQFATGFFVSFFVFYQAQIVTETNRVTVFVVLLAALLSHLVIVNWLEKITLRRIYRLKMFWIIALTMTQYLTVWALVSIATRVLNEALQSMFSFSAIITLLVPILMISAFIATASPVPEHDTKDSALKN